MVRMDKAAMDELLELIIYFMDAIVGDNGRFFACFVPALLAAALVLWLVPGWPLKLTLAVPVVAAGVASGIVWERRKK
jgi:membrane protein implicated in regulation of membrane protease activity